MLLTVPGAAVAWKSDKECNLKEVIGKCIKSDFQIESADKKQKNLPRNGEEMNTMCEHERKAEECIRAENLKEKCAENDEEKKALDHSLDGLVRVVKRVCQNDAAKNGTYDRTNGTEFALLSHINHRFQMQID